MTELGYVELPFIRCLRALGWEYRTEAQLDQYNRTLGDPIVERLLLDAIRRVNPAVKTDDHARRAVELLRGVLSDPDPLTANRRALEVLRDGVPLVLETGQAAVTVQFFEFDPDPEKQKRNTFIVTNQYSVKGTDTCRADLVLLVNGVPLVLCEFKSYLSAGKDWKEGVRQLHRYMREAPKLLVPNVFSVAADEDQLRYGTVHFRPDSEQVIRVQMDSWRPWLSLYPETRGYWNLKDGDPRKHADPIEAAARGLLRPATVLDFLQHFVVFETKEKKTVKKAARYQQFEAANDIVDRAAALIGDPTITSQDRTGLIWHTQGSGKSLTMIYAGTKLRRHPKLSNPTVLVVVDRSDLKTQLGDEFEDCDYPNVSKAMGVADLKAKLAGDGSRETIVTTIQCFQRMEALQPNLRDNIVLLIDECHRSQKGADVSGTFDKTKDPAGFALTMRAKLPNSFRFGFTGTPIDRTMVNTHRMFGPEKDGQQERYLSYYGIRQAIRDGATLPVHYLLRVVPLAVDQHKLDVGFEQMCAQMEAEEEEVKDFVQKKEANWKQLAKAPDRMKKVIAHVVDHFLEHPDPNGFKAQLVAIDRDAAGRFKDLLDEELIRRGLSKREAEGLSEVIFSAGFNDTDPHLTRYHYSKEKADELIGYFKLKPSEWEKWNRERYGDDRAQWRPALKVLIVCDKLLTGFDAPVEQVMYLDKPIRDHTLLQAMARTNRPCPDMGKLNGLIVDFFGVFEDMQKALNFDESEVEEAAIAWDKLKEQVPSAIQRCQEHVAGIELSDTRECLTVCRTRLRGEDEWKAFKDDFRHLETLWEALAPDECLYPYRKEYAALCAVYVGCRRRKDRIDATFEELGAKTRKLIRDNATFNEVVAGVPVYKIDADYLAKARELPTAEDRAAEIADALTRELIDGPTGFAYKLLGQRLQKLISDKTANLSRSVTDLEELVAAFNQLKGEPEQLGLAEPGDYALFTVIRGFAEGSDREMLVRAARGIAGKLRRQKALIPGWSDSSGGRNRLRTALMAACWEPDWEALQLCPEEGETPFLATALEELAKAVS